MPGKFRSFIQSLKNRPYASPDDLYRKRTKFGEINEFFKYQICASDQLSYAPPFLGNPLRSRDEQAFWRDTDSMYYEYLDPDRRAEAMRRFEFMFNMVKDRITPDDVVLDVGCNTGFFLDEFYKRGFHKALGLDPQKVAVEYARQHRPHLKITEGFFGPKSSDIPCDLLVFFGSVSRVPYQDRLFEAFDRTVRKYILIWVQESLDDFQRDLHVGLAKKGFVCIEKRVVSPEYIPIGLPGAEGPMLAFTPEGGIENHGNVKRLFHSHFLFRRLEVRD